MKHTPKSLEKDPKEEILEIIIIEGADLGSDGNLYWHPENIRKALTTLEAQVREEKIKEVEERFASAKVKSDKTRSGYALFICWEVFQETLETLKQSPTKR